MATSAMTKPMLAWALFTPRGRMLKTTIRTSETKAWQALDTRKERISTKLVFELEAKPVEVREVEING